MARIRLIVMLHDTNFTFPSVEGTTRSADGGGIRSWLSTEQGDCWSFLRLTTAATASTVASTSSAASDWTVAFSCWIVDGVMMILGWSCPAQSSDIIVTSMVFIWCGTALQMTFLKNGTKSLPKITSENLKNKQLKNKCLDGSHFWHPQNPH